MPAPEATAIGARNPRLRRLRQLIGRPRARSAERAFVVDGPVLVAEALRSGLAVTELFVGPDGLDGFGLADLVGPEVEVFQVDPSVLASALDPVNPRPVAAVVAAPTWTLDAVPTDRPLLVAVELRDPGNLGTLLRTAEAAGFGAVVVVGDSVDPLGPKAVRASAGSVLRLPVVRFDTVARAVEALARRGWPVLAAVVDPAAPSYDTVDLTAAAIMVGNEPHGLPAEAIRLGDGHLTIPLSGTVESLNVAAAASVLCFEAARQRRGGGPGHRKSVGQQGGEASPL